MGREGQVHPLQPLLLEFQRTWGQTRVDLDQAYGEAFIEALIDRESNRLGPAFRKALYRQTGGHALFSVELLCSLQERGALRRDAQGRWVEGPALDWDLLPARVEAIIAERMAWLGPEERELFAIASVEGEEFHAEIAARVLKEDEAQVVAMLCGPLSQEHRLVMAQSVYRVGDQRLSRYRFRHHLFQRYLYRSLDPVRLCHLHEEVGSALEALGAVPNPEELDRPLAAALLGTRAELLTDVWIVPEAAIAWHWEQAGMAEKAARCHLYAGRKANARTFNHEGTLWHISKALDLLATLPESPWRARWEQRCYYIMGLSEATTKSWIAPRVGQAWRQSLVRAEQADDRLLVANALTWLSIHHRAAGDLDLARSLGERAADLARDGPWGWVTWTRGSLAVTLLHRGHFTQAAQMLEPLATSLLQTGSIPPLWHNTELLVVMPRVLWCLGYPDRALRVSQEALAMVRREQDGVGVGGDAQVLCDAVCFTQQLRRDVVGVEQGMQMLLALIERQRCAPVRRSFATLYRGWVQAQGGDLEQGTETLRRGVAEWSQGYMILRPYWKGYLAEALARAERAEEGLALLAEALEQVERTHERWSEADLWQLKGELLLRQGEGSDQVEACFQHAIEVAQRQSARSWELRATVSLARLLQGQGRAMEARERLRAIYTWFTEGFGTPDLREAADLLGVLSA